MQPDQHPNAARCSNGHLFRLRLCPACVELIELPPDHPVRRQVEEGSAAAHAAMPSVRLPLPQERSASKRQELVDLVKEFREYLDHGERWSNVAWQGFVAQFAAHGVQPLPSGYSGRVTADDLLQAVERVL